MSRQATGICMDGCKRISSYSSNCMWYRSATNAGSLCRQNERKGSRSKFAGKALRNIDSLSRFQTGPSKLKVLERMSKGKRGSWCCYASIFRFLQFLRRKHQQTSSPLLQSIQSLLIHPISRHRYPLATQLCLAASRNSLNFFHPELESI
jgi:hypothetical protein